MLWLAEYFIKITDSRAMQQVDWEREVKEAKGRKTTSCLIQEMIQACSKE